MPKETHQHPSTVKLEPAEMDILLGLARARDAKEARRQAARLRAKLGPDAPAVELLLEALLARANELQDAMRLAMTDPLTGLANRRAFGDALRRELCRAERSGKPLAVLLLDLDGFKAINDTLSHAAGDDALRLVARCARQVTREGDLVARVGGDEFAIMLPETDADGAREIGERVRRRLARASQSGPSLDFSFGLGVTCEAHVSALALLAIADRELYRDKTARKSLQPLPNGRFPAGPSGVVEPIAHKQAS